jgi:pimeloyl-ACP methyl ester carboxylesterase
MPFAEARGIRFHFQRLGESGPVVVLVHGLAPYGNMAYWYFAIGPHVSPRHSFLLYDLRGFGLSDQPSTGYTMEDMVEDLDGLVVSLGLADQRIAVVGHSFGATIAMHYAIHHPERLSALVAIEPYLERGSEMSLVTGSRELLLYEEGPARELRAQELFEQALAGYVDPEGRPNQDARTTTRQVDRLRSRTRTGLRDKAVKLVSDTSLVDDLATLEPLTDEQLVSIACPTLLLYGDESFLRDEADRLAAQIPGSTLEILDATGHMMVQTAPRIVTDRLVQWLERLPG